MEMFVPRKIKNALLALYAAMLLCSVALLYTIPNKNLIPSVTNKQKAVAINEYNKDIFLNAAQEGRLDKVEGIYKNCEWNFDFRGKELEIITTGDERIMAQRKSVNDGKIQVINYVTKCIVYDVDFTDKIKSPNVKLEGNQLSITNPKIYVAKLINFNDDFTITQFEDRKVNKYDNRFTSEPGQKLIYLRIPKNVQLVSTKAYVQFIVRP